LAFVVPFHSYGIVFCFEAYPNGFSVFDYAAVPGFYFLLFTFLNTLTAVKPYFIGVCGQYLKNSPIKQKSI